MTPGEQKMLNRGVAAGALIGLVTGGLIALFIAMKPEFFVALLH